MGDSHSIELSAEHGPAVGLSVIIGGPVLFPVVERLLRGMDPGGHVLSFFAVCGIGRKCGKTVRPVRPGMAVAYGKFRRSTHGHGFQGIVIGQRGQSSYGDLPSAGLIQPGIFICPEIIDHLQHASRIRLTVGHFNGRICRHRFVKRQFRIAGFLCRSRLGRGGDHETSQQDQRQKQTKDPFLHRFPLSSKHSVRRISCWPALPGSHAGSTDSPEWARPASCPGK